MENQLAPPPQTTALAQLDFKDLPAVFEQNNNLTANAMLVINPKIEQLKGIDLATLEVTSGDALELEINDLRSRAAESEKLNKERRMIFTKRMDDVKSLFTGMERDLTSKGADLKSWCDAWNREKANRAAEIQRKNDLKMAHENAKIDFAAHVSSQIYLRYDVKVRDHLSRMSDAFYAKNLSNIAEYGTMLKTWTPEFGPLDYATTPSPLLTTEEILELKATTEAGILPTLSVQWIAKMTEERDRLIDLIPSRIAELERFKNDLAEETAATARIEAEKAQLEADLAAEAASRQASAEMEASTSKLNNMLDQAAIAPAVQLSKGAMKKLKYEPADHKEMVAIIQNWVAGYMALMTIDELKKKLSFMITAANKDLSKGTLIEGVTTVEDISTRTTKTKGV